MIDLFELQEQTDTRGFIEMENKSSSFVWAYGTREKWSPFLLRA